MATVKVGDSIPQGTFTYVPYTQELEDALVCGVPIKLSTDEWKGKKVVLFAVPGAFTPTCHAKHLPGFLEKYDEFKKKGVDVIAVVAANDPFVMSGWGRFEGLRDKESFLWTNTFKRVVANDVFVLQILALSDTNAQWSSQLGLTMDLTERGMGVRTSRYAIVLDDLKVTYLEVEPAPGVTVTGAEAVLARL